METATASILGLLHVCKTSKETPPNFSLLQWCNVNLCPFQDVTVAKGTTSTPWVCRCKMFALELFALSGSSSQERDPSPCTGSHAARDVEAAHRAGSKRAPTHILLHPLVQGSELSCLQHQPAPGRTILGGPAVGAWPNIQIEAQGPPDPSLYMREHKAQEVQTPILVFRKPFDQI